MVNSLLYDFLNNLIVLLIPTTGPQKSPVLLFFITTSSSREWVICFPAAILGYGSHWMFYWLDGILDDKMFRAVQINGQLKKHNPIARTLVVCFNVILPQVSLNLTLNYLSSIKF